MQNNKVGVLGIGIMGRCAMQCLIDAGYDVYVFDITQAACEAANKAGATVVSSPKQLAKAANTIIMSLPGPAQLESAIFAEDGLVNALSADSIVVDTSTVDPATTKSIAQRLEVSGAKYLDCPVLGRPSGVGKWLLPVGGDEQVLGEVEPILKTFAATVVHVGENGAGNAVKLLNQLMFSVINSISSEVMAIAQHCGVSKEIFYSTVASSSAATVSGLFKEVGKYIIEDKFEDPAFTVDLLIKDAKLALQMAKKAGAPSIIAGNIQMYNELASATGLGKEDTSALYKVYSAHYNRQEKDA